MKKLIAVSAVAALAATALSAEITFGSWGRALWVTAANAGYAEEKDDAGNVTKEGKSDIVTDVHQSWGGAAPRNGLSVRGNSDNVGFHLDIGANGAEAWLPGDNCNIWVKPVDKVKATVGRIDENELRGDACFGLWNWDRIGAVNTGNVPGQEGWTFADYLDAEGAGLSLVFYPTEELTIGVGLPLPLSHNTHDAVTLKDDDGKAEDPYLAKNLSDAWLNAAFVGAYKIADVGTIKAAAQLRSGKTVYTEKSMGIDFNKDGDLDDDSGDVHYLNKDGKNVKTWVNIAAAFDLTAVENLYASLGVVIPTLNSKPISANAYARYGVNEQLTVHAIVGTKINELDKKEGKFEGFGFLAGAGVDYALDGGIGIFLDARYANGIFMAADSTSDNKTDTFTLGAGVTKGFSNGVIGVAFEGTTNGGNYGRYGQKKVDDFAWEIPVKFEYCF